MRKIPEYSLWLGHVGDIRDIRSVLSTGIEAVVDLALNEPPAKANRELVYCRFPLLDGSGNPPWLLRIAVATIAGLLKSGTPTLVFCSAGMSRTPAVAGAAIAQLRGCSLADGVAIVTQSGAVDISPALLTEMQALFVST